MIKRILKLIRRARGKPWRIILFRAGQAMHIAIFARTGAWQRITAKASAGADRVAGRQPEGSPVLVTINPPSPTTEERAYLKRAASEFRTGTLKLFGHNAPDPRHADFSTDWRFGKHWSNAGFKNYRFYETKTVPYDVKFPWELSRFHYLVPVLTEQVDCGVDVTVIAEITTLLNRWQVENPLAYSVNWYPMESSMRAVSLVSMFDLATILWLRNTDEQEKINALRTVLVKMMYEHAHFIWINREVTDIRGNHFTANIVALDLLYCALAPLGLGQTKWGRYAHTHLPKEIDLQFCEDGVNFEKSCGYHKLVLELFLLSAIAARKRGTPLPDVSLDRLRKAAGYSEAITRPDGLTANFGDIDDAVGLAFHISHPREQGGVVELARAFFDDTIGTTVFPLEAGISARILLGKSTQTPAAFGGLERFHFEAGGYAIVRNSKAGFFFMMDIGEVGMAGRGGHGHNDLLAFELMLEGRPVIVDPGCSGYTADLDRKSWYRSTEAHATIKLHDTEIARFAGHWSIHDDAKPFGVSFRPTEDGAIISAGHDGYGRIAKGTQVVRQATVDAVKGRVILQDRIISPNPAGESEWFFPFSPELAKDISIENSDVVRIGTKTLTVDDTPKFNLKSTPFSTHYGQEKDSLSLVLTRRLTEAETVITTRIE